MSIFLLPKVVCKKIERLMGKLWWGNGNEAVRYIGESEIRYATPRIMDAYNL